MDREERLEKALELVKAHLIMNDMNTPRIHEKIEEALVGFYCEGCEKLLMPVNTIAAREDGGGMVYVHKETCDKKQF